MYVDKDDFITVLYADLQDQISDANEQYAISALAAAEGEVKSYLFEVYDVATIFADTAERDAKLTQLIKTIAKWYFIEVCNIEVLYDEAKERYQSAIDYLRMVADNDVTLDLKQKGVPDAADTTGTATDDGSSELTYGSHDKFNHDF